MYAPTHSPQTIPERAPADTVVSGKSRVRPEPPPKQGCSSVVVVSARDLVSFTYAHAARLARHSEVYGVTSARELCEVLQNVSAQRSPLGGLEMLALDTRGPGLDAGDALAALRASGWTETAFVISHEATLEDALSEGPTLVLITRASPTERTK